ncbi:MAG: hypothetical protein CMJ51_07130 [Planctomycetaceae bacterium]|nr:hypothetical protein [Planctomycetaceae bacterium]
MARNSRTTTAGLLRSIAVSGVIVAGITPLTASAASSSHPLVQDGATNPTQLVEDFLHYLLIAKPDLAEAAAQKLFDSGITPAEIAEIIREKNLDDKVERALTRGRGMSGVGPMVTRFENVLEQGRHDLARNQDRIREAIGMLDGSLRSQLMARRRLVEAGEYAVPELLQTLITTKSPEAELRVTEVLEEIKRQAVLPLCAALPELSPTVQAKVCRILSKIGWPTAIPFLLDLAADRRTTPEVRDAANIAFRRLGGTSTDVSSAYTALARKFFAEDQSLIAYPGDAANMVWSYGPHSGLVPTPVPTTIFSQVMAMRCARAALEADSTSRMALSTFVAADLRRENQLGDNESDPFEADSPYSPQFFATASGSSICRDVLAMAIDADDTALVRDAIQALGHTVGRGNMFAAGGRSPLLECLLYPDRRVQYDAALVLGSALPSAAFAGDTQVVPLLASAVRAGNQSFAAVVATTEEDRNRFAGMLKSAGFRVAASGGDFYELEAEINRGNGVDLIIVQESVPNAVETVGRVRAFGRTGATPVLLVSDAVDGIRLDREFAEDRATVSWDGSGSDVQFGSTIERLMKVASGGRMTEVDAMTYTRNALQTLAVIARADGAVYKINDAEPALLEAMGTISGGMRLLVADVVALIGTDRAQRALMDAAIASSNPSEQIALLDRAAANARSFGSRVEARQSEALRRLIAANAGAGGNAGIADAAGRLYGSLDLPTDEAVSLITGG